MEKRPRVKGKIIHRNDPCPCGREKITSYPGSSLPEKVTIIKFKNCCLDGRTTEMATIRSTAEILKAKRMNKGYPKKLVLTNDPKLVTVKVY